MNTSNITNYKPKDFAKELEVSRATLFRKLKKARENGSDIVK